MNQSFSKVVVVVYIHSKKNHQTSWKFLVGDVYENKMIPGISAETYSVCNFQSMKSPVELNSFL